jgi:hypothetical protein
MIAKLANEAAVGNMLHAGSIIIVTETQQPLDS